MSNHIYLPRNESGFVLALVVFLLSVCTLLGIASMNNSVNEIDIAANEVITKRVFYLAGSGLPLAAVPLLTTQGSGAWPDNTSLNDRDPSKEATSGSIKIIDGGFLSEGRDQDIAGRTGWNNGTKYRLAPTSIKEFFKAIDDPFDTTAETKGPDGTVPDVRIRTADLTIDVDVDKVDVTYLPGGVAEFGSGAEGSAGSSYKIIYLMDCMATLPGRDLTKPDSPKSELILGYRFIPDTGI